MGYPGGKNGAGVFQRIISLMPPHRVYIEAFLGGGAVLRMKRPAVVNIGLDLDPAVIAGWKILPPNMAATADASAGAGESGGARSRWEIRAGDGIDFLRWYPFRGDELVYCDPPYMMETRSSGRLYACELSTARHGTLLRLLKRLPCMVMVSGYWSELYGRELAAWRSIQFESMTRGGMATETLWMNFPPAVELHDYRYLGSNRREREQLKRQKARWVARLGRMDELKRGALLSAIQEYSACGIAGGRQSPEVAAADPAAVFNGGARRW